MKKKKFLIITFCTVLLIVAVLLIFSRTHKQGLYQITILPSFAGASVLPRAINDNGQIAGYLKFPNGNNHLFLWDKANGIRDLGPVSGSVSINNAGQIAASFLDPNNNQRAFLWDPNSGRTILPAFGGNYSFAYSINNRGQVVGDAKTSNGVKHAFIWDDVIGICDLTPNSTKDTHAWSINDTGQVIVSQGSNILVNTKGNNIISSLTIPFFNLCMINNNGFIVSTLLNKHNTFDVAIWHPVSSQTSIIKSNTSSLSQIYKINDLNQVIITELFQYKYLFKRNKSYIKTHNYFCDPKLGMISLDGYIKIKKGEDFGLIDINNNGWIIGAFGSEDESNFTGVLFEPIPEKMDKLIKKSSERE